MKPRRKTQAPLGTPLGRTLRRLLQHAGLHESELARRTGIAQPVINRMCSGSTDNPHVKTLLPIARLFDLSIEALLGETPLLPAADTQRRMLPQNLLTDLQQAEQILQGLRQRVAQCVSGEDLIAQENPFDLYQRYRQKYGRAAIGKFMDYLGIGRCFGEMPTNAEVNILVAMALDPGHKQVAEALKISYRTVSVHTSKIGGKLKAGVALTEVVRTIRGKWIPLAVFGAAGEGAGRQRDGSGERGEITEEAGAGGMDYSGMHAV